ncbi:MAG: hypothetical protein KDI73_08580 [Candidatus Competibacteraceae bacterium]|nr:hypothetical protein [Candidatus Competibacteraceae bacterium]
MTHPRLWLIPLILLALFSVGGVLLWLSQHLIQRSEEVYTGYDEAARRNPFYLAERLLTRLGRTVHSVRRLDELPHPLHIMDTLLIAIPSYALSAADSQWLLDWVKAGGHLLVSVQQPYEPGQGRDHLLNSLEVHSQRVEEPVADPVSVKLSAAMTPLQVRFRADLRLNGDFWRSFEWGAGRITLLTDLSLFTNGRLAEHEHADFLWGLLHQSDPGGELWLQYRMLTPSLAQLLWQYAWMPLAGLILTLMTALWSYSQRLGPLPGSPSGA